MKIERLNNLTKIILFLTAYSPLFLILLLKNNNAFLVKIYNFKYNEFLHKPLESLYLFVRTLNEPIFYLILITIFVPFLVLCLFICFQKRTNCKQYKVLSIKDVSHESLSYILTYIIAFLSLDLPNIADILSILILIIIIGMVYINSSLIHINPILYFCGYSIMELNVFKDEKEENILLLVPNKEKLIYRNSYINISLINNGFKDIYFYCS